MKFISDTRGQFLDFGLLMSCLNLFNNRFNAVISKSTQKKDI